MKSSHIVVGCSENVCMQWALDDKWQELQRRCPGNRSSSPRVQVCRSVKWDGCYAWGELQTKEKKGHGSHEDYRAAAAYPSFSFLWMQNSSSCIHDRERTNVFCVTETLWSQTQKPLCVTWASLYCIPQLSWDFQQQQQEEVVTRRGELNWKSLKTLLLTDCKLQHYSWLLLFSIRKDLSAYWENQYSTLGSFELQATTIPHVN